MLSVKSSYVSFLLYLLLVDLMLEIYLKGNHLARCSFNFLPEIEFSPSRISASQGTKLKENQLYIDFLSLQVKITLCQKKFTQTKWVVNHFVLYLARTQCSLFNWIRFNKTNCPDIFMSGGWSEKNCTGLFLLGQMEIQLDWVEAEYTRKSHWDGGKRAIRKTKRVLFAFSAAAAL